MKVMAGLWNQQWVRRALERFKVPLPLPPVLRRDIGPETEQTLKGRWVMTGRDAGRLAGEAAAACVRAGAGLIVPEGEDFPTYGEGFNAAEPQAKTREIMAESVDICIFDTTGFQEIAHLGELFTFLNQWIRKINDNGRVLLLAPAPGGNSSPTDQALNHALAGITRALSKELGDKGITVHLIVVPSSAGKCLEPVIRFLASDRSAFVTGQVWRLSKLEQKDEHSRFVNFLEGKVALVTGGARGIGAAIARCLAQEGAEVVLVDRPERSRELSRVAADLQGTPLVVDLTWPKAASFIADQVKKKHGKLDILVHNAGVYLDCKVAAMAPDKWKNVFDINLNSVIRLTEALDTLILEGGRIIGIASISGITGIGGQTCYSGSKAGMAGYLQSLARDMDKRNITVNAIAAGYIHTALTSDLSWFEDLVGQRMTALRQGGIPEDIGNFVAFLASPGASCLNGQVIRACGGNFIGA